MKEYLVALSGDATVLNGLTVAANLGSRVLGGEVVATLIPDATVSDGSSALNFNVENASVSQGLDLVTFRHIFDVGGAADTINTEDANHTFAAAATTYPNSYSVAFPGSTTGGIGTHIQNYAVQVP